MDSDGMFSSDGAGLGETGGAFAIQDDLVLLDAKTAWGQRADATHASNQVEQPSALLAQKKVVVMPR